MPCNIREPPPATRPSSDVPTIRRRRFPAAVAHEGRPRGIAYCGARHGTSLPCRGATSSSGCGNPRPSGRRKTLTSARPPRRQSRATSASLRGGRGCALAQISGGRSSSLTLSNQSLWRWPPTFSHKAESVVGGCTGVIGARGLQAPVTREREAAGPRPRN